MIYPFNCPECGKIEIQSSMADIKEVMTCPKCGQPCKRSWESGSGSIIWKCDGAFGKST